MSNEPYDEVQGNRRLDRLLGAVDFPSQLVLQERKHRSETCALLLCFVEVLDSFHRLFGVWKKQEKDGGANDQETIRSIAEQLDLALRRVGVQPISSLGQRPEPGRHQVVAACDVPGVDVIVIVEEILCGYEWNGEILRKSSVVVSRGRVDASNVDASDKE
jgi:molecular chaperone GrpE (heat shock protein)